MTEKPQVIDPYQNITWTIMGLGMLIVLFLHLLPALLAGLLVFDLIHAASPLLDKKLPKERAKVVVAVIIAAAVVALVGVVIALSVTFFANSGNITELANKMAEALEQSRSSLPAWLTAYLPKSFDDAKQSSVVWLRAHADALQTFGKDAGITFAYIIIGMVIGALSAIHTVKEVTLLPLAESLSKRATKLGQAFRNIVFAQTKISLVNTSLTAIYLLVVLPVFDVHLPLAKTLVMVTFFTGLLPVLGNLLSNSVIVVVSLSQSPQVALASLAYLVAIHKLEYFLNAKIVGMQISSKAWELLLAMVAMEAAFGVPGLIAAPIYYAYLKAELVDAKLV